MHSLLVRSSLILVVTILAACGVDRAGGDGDLGDGDGDINVDGDGGFFVGGPRAPSCGDDGAPFVSPAKTVFDMPVAITDGAALPARDTVEAGSYADFGVILEGLTSVPVNLLVEIADGDELLGTAVVDSVFPACTASEQLFIEQVTVAFFVPLSAFDLDGRIVDVKISVDDSVTTFSNTKRVALVFP